MRKTLDALILNGWKCVQRTKIKTDGKGGGQAILYDFEKDGMYLQLRIKIVGCKITADIVENADPPVIRR